MIRYKYSGEGFVGWQGRASLYAAEFLVRLYQEMLRIRLIEEEIEREYPRDEMKSPIHLMIGQEATSVGVCAALDAGDPIFLSHRTHGNYLAKGGSLKAMMAELYCRKTGCAESRGGSMHLFDKEAGVVGGSAIVGGSVPMATGAALGSKMKRDGKIACAFFGDAGAEEGAVWESINFAVLKTLPIVYVCENNFYSVCSPLVNRQPSVGIHQKAAGFGLPSVVVDGVNVLDVYEAVRTAVQRARSGGGPSFIESRAYRWRGHGGPGDDSHAGYRDPQEVREWEAACPIRLFGEFLKERNLLTDGSIETMRKEIEAEVAEAIAFAKSSPVPEESDLYRHGYAGL
jgi:pyruvate dehydrogenase E1 component alpha subunit